MAKILVIEDDTNINDMVRNILAKTGIIAHRHFPEARDRLDSLWKNLI